LSDSRFDIESLPSCSSSVVSASIGGSLSNGFDAALVSVDLPGSNSMHVAPGLTMVFFQVSTEERAELPATATDLEAEIETGGGIAAGMGTGIAALIVIGIICLVGFLFLRRRTWRSELGRIPEEEESTANVISWNEEIGELVEVRSNENMLASDDLADLFDGQEQSDESEPGR
jgi:hypothetical protein